MSRTHTDAASDRERLSRLRRFLLITLMVGIAGMGLELLFIGHVEDRLQCVPVVLLPAGLIALVWHALRPSRASARGVRLLMALFVASGLLGVGLHYRGNHEFELEMYPSMAGMELVRRNADRRDTSARARLDGAARARGARRRPRTLVRTEQDGSDITEEDVS